MNDIGPLKLEFAWWFWVLAIALFPLTILYVLAAVGHYNWYRIADARRRRQRRRLAQG